MGWLASGIIDADFTRVQDTGFSIAHQDGFFRYIQSLAAGKYFLVCVNKGRGLLQREEIMVAFAQQRSLFEAEQFLARSVKQLEPQVAGIFEKHHCRNLLNHAVEQRFRPQ